MQRETAKASSAPEPIAVALGLGANRDAPVATVRRAVARLAEKGLREIRLSGLYLTRPEDCRPGTPDFVNGALVGRWPGSPQSLLAACHGIEREMGRPADHARDEARTIDLDILLVKGCELQTDNLRTPHPRLVERLFVLTPLAEVAGDWPVEAGGRRRPVAVWLRALRQATPGHESLVRPLPQGGGGCFCGRPPGL